MDSGDAFEIKRPPRTDDAAVPEGRKPGSDAAPEHLVRTSKGADLARRVASEALRSKANSATVRAIEASTRTPRQTVRFALGVPVGFLASSIIVGLVELLFPLQAPAILWGFVLPGTIGMGILFARVFPLEDVFTSAELALLERAETIRGLKNRAREADEAQMRRNGLTGSEIEARLGPDRELAQREYLKVLASIEGKVPLEGDKGDPPQ